MTYFFGRDNEGQWYTVEANKRYEWNEWVAQERGPVPPFAKRIEGVLSQKEFRTLDETEKAFAVLKEIDEYLSGNKLNSIGSGSVLHKMVKEVLEGK